MNGLLSSIAKGASYLYGGGVGEEDEPNSTDNQDEVKQEHSAQQHQPGQPNAQQYEPRNVFCSAKGELWKFNPKREEFTQLMPKVEIRVIEHDAADFVSSFTVTRPNGDVLFTETVTNKLQVQYNKSNHSMVFAMFIPQKDQIQILSFIFADEKAEEEFKMAMAIKLYEHNRGESFAKLLKNKDAKEEDNAWMVGAYEEDADRASEYEESDTDLRDLCEDVQMLDMSNTFDRRAYTEHNMNIGDDGNFDTANGGDEEYDDEEYDVDEEEEHKRNGYEEAANKGYSDEEDLRQHTSKALPRSPFKDDVRPSKSAMNKHITGSKLFNRTYVVRDMKPGAAALGYFKHNDMNELEYQGKIAIKDAQNQAFTPSKVMQHKSDRAMLLLSEHDPGMVYNLNLDKGKVVEQWRTKDSLLDITPLTKHDEMTDNQMVYGLNANSLFQIDGRVPKESKVIDSKQKVYKSIRNLSAIATSGNGFIATAAKDGKIRLHDCVEKRAKTCLPGLGNGVKALECSDNGQWILATCEDYIMVIPTQVPGSERTGFEGRGMGKMKPHPYVLRLTNKDKIKYKLRKVSFTPAHFDQGTGIDEHWIISSTGKYIIKWNFAKLKKSGIVNSYSIRLASAKVVHNEFRYNYNDDILVSETNSVYAQGSSMRKK